MSVPDPTSGPKSWPTMLTWNGHTATQLESARVNLAGNRIRAYGRIISAATADHEAFSASYDLVTDEEGGAQRLSVSVLRAGGDRQVSVTRDTEGNWLVHTLGSVVKSGFNGALDVDMERSSFFNTLLLRRLGLHLQARDIDVPVMYLRLPELEVSEVTLQYRADPVGIRVVSPVSESVITIDSDGFILDYPGLARRV
ncbi:putative glycolipid-binding domain-containing protein [Segniliparus rugosus]|uniref:Glycolipid-binding domain-containing protein n=1 Tax=Segniliparus rugosus (strain ATCC BAA-974 / DSM 45345 / CCUG 50838 / CIP 108380 / JCM 13579 / CDC 945) TaxID=679197 RepID=E5XTT5_SEGRC|nr:putative glycolipid-binding domain-containing protein [Segniliparus rugosus]EFV12215.1 hypothetical protein HMPREF9336_02907 [Segniliparus rugosus ATCC BAA-974]